MVLEQSCHDDTDSFLRVLAFAHLCVQGPTCLGATSQTSTHSSKHATSTEQYIHLHAPYPSYNLVHCRLFNLPPCCGLCAVHCSTGVCVCVCVCVRVCPQYSL